MFLFIVYLLHLLTPSTISMQTFKYWADRPMCIEVVKPLWPFALTKVSTQTYETKGRSASNFQHIGHNCGTRGGRTKCRICENIKCGLNYDQVCPLQIQGMDWDNLPKNVPTISDAPWAIGGSHRYDFKTATHVCVVLGKECARPDTTLRLDFRACSLRCWGYNTIGQQTELSSTIFSLRWTTLTTDYSDLSSGNMQGRVLHMAGKGTPGDAVGNGLTAQFKFPQAIALLKDGSILVADTGNNRVCRVVAGATLTDPGIVSVIAGTGIQGDQDGLALTEAKFAKPGGITVYYESGTNEMVVIIADTNNHRIRKLYQGVVTTLSGRRQQGPQQGYRDGIPQVARFNFPRRVLADPEDGVIYVSDSYNHLIRRIEPSGNTTTLTGNTETVTTDDKGCPPPCLKGMDGYRDGNLTFARFHQPNGMAWGMNGTLLVLDGHRIRRIEFRGLNTIQGVRSSNRVSTIAGGAISGKADGLAEEATFNEPKGVTMAADGRIYVADFVGSRIRRLTRAYDIPKDVTCETRGDSLVRPSGCSSYDVPTDATLNKGTPIAGNIYYNRGLYLTSNDVFSPDMYSQLDSVRDRKLGAGLRIRSCLGFPPPLTSLSSSGATIGPQSGTTVKQYQLDEDAGLMTEVRVKCPAGCGAPPPSSLYGSQNFTDFSRVCAAAIHSNIITHADGGFVVVRFTEGLDSYIGSVAHGVTSDSYSLFPRSFQVYSWDQRLIQTETIAGRPGSFLQENRGPRIESDRIKHTQPPMAAFFDRPSDIAVDPSKSLTDETTLFVLDQFNHRLMRITAVCSQACENGGTCVAPETCRCAAGWRGQDCTLPTCNRPCPDRSMCVAPDVCACVPGFSNSDTTQLFQSIANGPYQIVTTIIEPVFTMTTTATLASSLSSTCATPLCVQTCVNGFCSLPDTCSCSNGWFGTNCTVPVCSQTCGNGGNCTAPNHCNCASEWQGNECRTPVCEQTCINGGVCTAPNTCTCPREWSGYNCSYPVCEQGKFLKNGNSALDTDAKDGIGRARAAGYYLGEDGATSWVQYVPCQYDIWCTETNGFDCIQKERESNVLEVPNGPNYRSQTGFKENPGRCFWIEVTTTARVPFQRIDQYGGIQPHWRYPPTTIYGWDGMNTWSSPNVSDTDRQVVLVELREIVQGPYVCANGGDCIRPGYCECDEKSWIGFDCRIPVCDQGYHQPSFQTKHPMFPAALREPLHPDGKTKWNERYKDQGAYECSIRAYTPWENPFYLHQHPNYYSRYMTEMSQGRVAQDFQVYMWPDELKFTRMYNISDPLYDDVKQGWRRMGEWNKLSNAAWPMGKCTVEYDRQCFIPEIQHLTISSNANAIGFGGSPGKIGGTIDISFDGSSMRNVQTSSTANEMRIILEKLLSVGTVWVTRTNFDVQKKGAYTSYPKSCGTYVSETSAVLSGDILPTLSMMNANKEFCIDTKNVPGCDNTHRCYGILWSITFYTNHGDMPSLLVSTGGPFVTEDKACDGAGEMEDMKRSCSLEGGSQKGFPPRYTDAAATVLVTPYREGVYTVVKMTDVRTLKHGYSVLNPHQAYGPRTTSTDQFTSSWGRWNQNGGDCVDMVIRGCLNNGTCVAPGQCQCGPGWSSTDCRVPICEQPCLNNGNCTLPNLCTCEKGWAGHDCSYALCAQECNNGGKCVAPDVCQCMLTQNTWVDGRLGGGRPLFRDEFGDPQNTGWTGFDCSTPICTQAAKFKMKDDGTGRVEPPIVEMGWTPLDPSGTAFLGGDGYVLYGDEPTNNLMYQMPSYDAKNLFTIQGYQVVEAELDKLSWKGKWVPSDGVIIRNEGRSFQSGCTVVQPTPAQALTAGWRKPYPRIDAFLNPLGPGSGNGHRFRASHYVKGWASTTGRNDTTWRRTSESDLCNVIQWEEGDYTEQGLDHPVYKFDDRRIKVNYNNYIKETEEIWVKGPPLPGEGLFQCFNRGSCVSPDVCSCPDGYDGFDCRTPLCRYEQRDNKVSKLEIVGCLNGGLCQRKDTCECILSNSIMHTVHLEVKRFPLFPPYDAITGYIGTDCSIPKCVQGFWDHECRGVAPGGEGCFRCANGGNCTAPDFCTCPPEWTGYDCNTPVCIAIADSETVWDLQTVDLAKIQRFEFDPCQSNKKHFHPNLVDQSYSQWRYGPELEFGQGNCSRPAQCTCTCWEENPMWDPWQDPLGRGTLPGRAFGTSGLGKGACADGYEGNRRRDNDNKFMTCHLSIKVPSVLEQYSITFIIFGILLTIILSILYYYWRQWLKRRYLRKKAERRRSRKSSESSVGGIGGRGASSRVNSGSRGV